MQCGCRRLCQAGKGRTAQAPVRALPQAHTRAGGRVAGRVGRGRKAAARHRRETGARQQRRQHRARRHEHCRAGRCSFSTTAFLGIAATLILSYAGASIRLGIHERLATAYLGSIPIPLTLMRVSSLTEVNRVELKHGP